MRRALTRRHVLISGAAVVGGVIAGASARATSRVVPQLSRASTRARVGRPAVRSGVPLGRTGWASGVIGTSVEGRPIERWDAVPDHVPTSTLRHVVVICGIHGDERAADVLAERFGEVDVPADLHLTIIPRLNPDGWDAGTRNNANDIDLNRNFPWRFFDPEGGDEANSEPETQAITRMVTDERPDLTIWVHQPLEYTVSMPNTPGWWSEMWSETVGLAHRDLVLVGGGGESWAAQVVGCRSILIEGSDDMSADEVDAHGLALERLLPHVVPVD